MKSRTRRLHLLNVALALVACAHGFDASAGERKSITFDPPGSTGTTVVVINQAGMIAGNYTDATHQHGFLRSADGAITSFDPPGGSGTSVFGMNSEGAIVGTYTDGSGNSQLFLRTARGTFTTIQLPLGLGFMLGAVINGRDEIAGNYFDSTVFGLDSFLRSADGSVAPFTAPTGYSFATVGQLNNSGTVIGWACNFVNFMQTCSGLLQTARGDQIVFDPPGSTNTTPAVINSGGEIAGTFTANQTSHGFVRSENGAIHTFDVQGSTGTYPSVINSAGTTAGIYTDAASNPHGFVRGHHGGISTFDFPPAAPNTQGRVADITGINPEGTVAGGWVDDTFVPPSTYGGLAHGFVRTKEGDFITVDPEGSTGTAVVGITPEGLVAGFYLDSKSVQHGFVFRREDD